MRNSSIPLLTLLAAVSACAARPGRATVPATTQVRYACGELELVRSGDRLYASEAAADGPMIPNALGFRDDAGDHFVSFPTSPTEVEAIEYVLPHDRHADATEKTYDTSRGNARVDWRQTAERRCKVEGGYTDAFTRWAGGDSYDQVASDLALGDRDEAKDLVHEGLVRANKRFYRR